MPGGVSRRELRPLTTLKGRAKGRRGLGAEIVGNAYTRSADIPPAA